MDFVDCVGKILGFLVNLYKAFAPEEALRILGKSDIDYTHKRGNWLNMAEIELSILSRQCLDRRIMDKCLGE